MDLAAQERARGQHDRFRRPRPAIRSNHPGHPAGTIDDQILDRGRLDGQSRLRLEQPGDRLAVQHSVGLRPGATHGRTLGAIEHPELNAGLIDRAAHQAIQGIDLTHQVATAEASNRRVARHHPDAVPLVGEQQGARAQPGAGRGSLASGVAAADHDHVVAVHERCFGDAVAARQLGPPPRHPGEQSGRPISAKCRLKAQRLPKPTRCLPPTGATAILGAACFWSSNAADHQGSTRRLSAHS